MKSDVIFALWPHVATVAIALLIGLVFGTAACKKREQNARPLAASATPQAPERGERVVVEPAAAEFFEARVLELQGDRVRVQMAANGDTKLVALSDVYRLRPPTRNFSRGDFVICKPSGSTWSACRVESSESGLTITNAEGKEGRVAPTDAIAPSAVTELNIRRRFDRAEERAEFERGLVRAGSPVAPAGWKPGPSERVLARLEAGWFAGSIHELGKKEVRVAWQGNDRITDVAITELVPAPPYSVQFHKGDYALVRPLAPSGAWQPMRIESTAENEVVLRDAAANKRSVAPSDLVPLVARGDGG